ncbi:unnamed protein product [Anisakis simplex]|uniref:Hexosyltransferase n=1 Tax=Anisakis simplex TaxID=6269 RepID=A0A0M3K528_ANISI|nr:unnamed protein product [Anisakis simplex]
MVFRFASVEVYKPDYYPTYLSGGGIMFVSSAIPKIIDVLRFDDPYFSVDDAFISGVLAERANIPRICLKSFLFGYSGLTSCWPSPPLAIIEVGAPNELAAVIDKVKTGMATCNETDYHQ